MGDYSHFRPIPINPTDDKVGETDVNFAVLLNLTAAGSGVISDLATTGNGGDIRNTAAGGASGAYTVPADLTFRTTADLTIEGANLDFEVEYYDATTGALIVWVQCGVIASDHFDIYVIYGNADVTTSQESVSGTWDANFLMVQHLADVTTSTVVDSTSNNNDGTKKGANEPVEAGGQIGHGQDFDGSDDYIRLSSTFSDDAGTVEAWIKFSGSDEGILTLVTDANGNDSYLQFIIDVDRTAFIYAADTKAINIRTQEALSTNTWYYVVFLSNGTNTRIYVNGVNKALTVVSGDGKWSNDASTNAANIGALRRGTEIYSKCDGILDEVRYSNIARSDNYVTTAHNNQSDPSTFYSVGAEQGGRMPPWGGIVIFQDPGIM